MRVGTINKMWRDSATLMVGGRNAQSVCNFQMLMLQRSEKSKFMPSADVFPGGVLSPSDYCEDWLALFSKNEVVNHGRRLDVGPRAPMYTDFCERYSTPFPPEVAFRICALRETFEESGLLLTVGERGKRSVLADPDQVVGGRGGRTLQEWRSDVDADAGRFIDLCSALGHLPDVDSLYSWSTWLTPLFASGRRRFDTVFYLTLIDNTPNCFADLAEVSQSRWISPLERLQEHCTGERILHPPQLYELIRLSRFTDENTLEEFASSRESFGLERWCPHKCISVDGDIFVTYPGDSNHCYDPHKESSAVADGTHLSAEHLNRDYRTSIPSQTFSLMNNFEWCGHPPLGNITADQFLNV